MENFEVNDLVIFTNSEGYSGDSLTKNEIYTIGKVSKTTVELIGVKGKFKKERFSKVDLEFSWDVRRHSIYLNTENNYLYYIDKINKSGLAQFRNPNLASICRYIFDPRMKFISSALAFEDTVKLRTPAEFRELGLQFNANGLNCGLTGYKIPFNDRAIINYYQEGNIKIDGTRVYKKSDIVLSIVDANTGVWNFPTYMFKIITNVKSKKEKLVIGKGSIVNVTNNKVLSRIKKLKEATNYPVLDIIETNHNYYAKLEETIYVKLEDLKLIDKGVKDERKAKKEVVIEKFKGSVKASIS